MIRIEHTKDGEIKVFIEGRQVRLPEKNMAVVYNVDVHINSPRTEYMPTEKELKQ